MLNLLQRIFREWGYALLEDKGEGACVLLSEPPAWFTDLWGTPQVVSTTIPLAEKSPFLAGFLEEAESRCVAHGAQDMQSEIWLEKTVDGNEIPLQATAFWIDGRRVLVIRNLGSHYQERLQLLQSARNAALTHEELLREIQKKEILLHCIVHDLSQPLSAMRAAFDCLAGESVSERAQGFANIGKLASEQQESMIAAILQTFSADLRSALEGNKELNTTPDLLHSATVAMVTLSPAFEAKRVRLSLDPKIDKGANWRVTGEETRLRRVFLNLLENALRYSSAEGAVVIGLEQEGGTCAAFVDDEGPGLPEDLPSAEIFTLLSKGKQGGGKAGLGLYFCKVTVERWGGTIGCASRPERGSRFWFRLPQAAGAAQAARPLTSQSSPQKGKEGEPAKRRKLSILFADDQEEIRTLTTHQLARSGHKVRAVASGKEAVKAVQQGRFDVVLLDEEMPGMSGVEVARAVREQACGSRQPPLLVAVTANSTAQDRERLLAAGFDEAVGKPFRLEAFHVILDGLAAHASALRSSREVEVPEEDPVEALSQRVNGDKKLMKKLIHRFLCDLPSRMNSLRRAVRRGDAHELATHAHTLKGTVSIFGAAQARTRSQELQDLGRSGELGPAQRVYELLEEDIAKLEEKLKGYTQPAKSARRARGGKRPRAGQQAE